VAIRPRLLITRPAAQAAGWVHDLSARGWPASALPLLAIADAPDPAALHAAWAGLGRRSAVMFVSPNAVERFFAARPCGGAAGPWPEGVVAASTGPGTTRALQVAGVPSSCVVDPPLDAAAFDSEHLWPRLATLRPWAGTSVLIVRGDGGRDWLAGRWREAGAVVDLLEAYVRAEPVWHDVEHRLAEAARADPAAHVWLFSSSEAIRTLGRCWSVPAGARAVATHPAIARSAREAGFADVRACAPDLSSVIACLESGFC
jgi:uroporphyrinogen-III synthase